MVVGDFITQASAINTAQTYVPAGTSQFMLLSYSCGGSGSSAIPSFNVGGAYAEMTPPDLAAGAGAIVSQNDYANMKYIIDNTASIRVPNTGGGTYSVICLVQVA